MIKISLFPLSISLLLMLSACSSLSPSSTGTQVVTDDKQCPLNLQTGQTLILNLPSNPSTGYRWQAHEMGAPLLKSLGPEVYIQAKNEPLGGEGTASWRWLAEDSGSTRLLLSYQRPWESTGEAADLFDCRVNVD